MQRTIILILLAVASLVFAGCDLIAKNDLSKTPVVVTGASIESATMATGFSNGEAVGRAATFASNTKIIHCVVTTANPQNETRVKAVWTAVDARDAGGTIYTDRKMEEKEGKVAQLGEIIDFTMESPNLWPVGRYKVDLYLDGTLDRTLTFEVK